MPKAALNLAVLGANGQIGRGLAEDLSAEFSVYAVVRDSRTFQNSNVAGVLTYDRLMEHRFDLVINAAGPGDPHLQRSLGSEIFRITEILDDQVLRYLHQFPEARYLFVSTGAVYRFLRPELPDHDPVIPLPSQEIVPEDCYALAKLYAEIKHREHRAFRIWDVRVFGYFSRHISLNGSFFLSQLAASLVRRIPFRTHGIDFFRDYICFDDLGNLVRVLLCADPPNQAFDLFSAMPLTKSELLEACEARYGLRVEITDGSGQILKVSKPALISQDRSAVAAGYTPRRTSLETVLREIDHLVEFSSGRALTGD